MIRPFAMGVIRELPRDVIERIAAGEVVERPASVVRELVENAIDAGASSIAVDVAEGGRRRIAVIDDGCGMDAEDVARCALRHATSKIAAADDLWNIRTMGFRGEALAAIGAVSRLTIASRPNRPGAIEGARIEIEGGRMQGPVAAGCAGGTRVVVGDLFFNVPARLKFLRSAAVEFGHVHGAVTALALACPAVRFELSADGKRRFLSPAGDLKGRVAEILGDTVHERLLAVEEAGAGIAITGWVAEGGRTAKDVHFFLNRRPVRDRLLMHAVQAAFGGQIGRGDSPAAVLWLEIDPAQVDVNVHPAKREVRFASGGAVHDFVMHAVRKALTMTPSVQEGLGRMKVDTVPSLRLAASSSYGPGAKTDSERRLSSTLSVASMRVERGAGERVAFERAGRSEESVFAFGPRGHKASLRVIGQLGTTYVVCEDRDGTLVLIDQHAAHERLGFDQLKASYARGFIPQQVLLVPERVELGPREQAYVVEHLDVLAKAGFEIEPFGGGSLLVKAVPDILGDGSVATLLANLANELEELGSSGSVDEAREKIFAVVACHRQVRAGDRLLPEELAALVRDVERENIAHCPHGRPALVRIEKAEIEKWFKRRSH